MASATREDFETDGLIGRYTACELAAEKLLAAGFIVYGRSEKSEAAYYGRPSSTKPRLRIAAHGGRREDVGVYLDFEDRLTAEVETEIEIDGEDDPVVETRTVTHTGFDEDDLDDMIAEVIAAYDAQSEGADDE